MQRQAAEGKLNLNGISVEHPAGGFASIFVLVQKLQVLPKKSGCPPKLLGQPRIASGLIRRSEFNRAGKLINSSWTAWRSYSQSPEIAKSSREGDFLVLYEATTR